MIAHPHWQLPPRQLKHVCWSDNATLCSASAPAAATWPKLRTAATKPTTPNTAAKSTSRPRRAHLPHGFPELSICREQTPNSPSSGSPLSLGRVSFGQRAGTHGASSACEIAAAHGTVAASGTASADGIATANGSATTRGIAASLNGGASGPTQLEQARCARPSSTGIWLPLPIQCLATSGSRDPSHVGRAHPEFGRGPPKTRFGQGLART